jgi:hypothetical protein
MMKIHALISQRMIISVMTPTYASRRKSLAFVKDGTEVPIKAMVSSLSKSILRFSISTLSHISCRAHLQVTHLIKGR